MKRILLLQVALLVCLTAPFVSTQNRFLDRLIPDDYDKYRPPLQHGHVLVNTSMKVYSFDSVENEFNLQVDLVLCLKWYDQRILPFDISTVSDTIPGVNITENMVFLTEFNRLWLPNVYFRNAYGSGIVDDLQFVEVWPDNKLINYCSRMILTFECRFKLSNFPFDEQYCYFELESFGMDTRILKLQMLHHIQSPGHNDQFVVRESLLGYCLPGNNALNPFHNVYHTVEVRGNNQSCLYTGLRIVRHVNYYIIRYYLTTFLLVMMMFVEFYYPTNAWPARIILTCVVLINIMGISRQGYSHVPSKDVTSLFWWFWWCQFTVYMGLIEFAVALAWVQFVLDKKIAHEKNVKSPDGHYFGQRTWYYKCGQWMDRCLHKLVGPIPFFDSPEGRNKVDYVSRFLFPGVFLFGVLIYIVATIPAWAAKY